jgi:hypothetical protein
MAERIMRNKIVLIKGFAHISEEITNAEFERINADHIVVIAALRKPQLLPDKFKSMNLTLIEFGVIEILKHWKEIEQEHLIAAEYAQIVVDHGKEDIKCVEGNSLHVSWFYETIRAIHRQFNQIIIDVEVETGWSDDIRVRIDETLYKKYEAINVLNPDKWKV